MKINIGLLVLYCFIYTLTGFLSLLPYEIYSRVVKICFDFSWTLLILVISFLLLHYFYVKNNKVTFLWFSILPFIGGALKIWVLIFWLGYGYYWIDTASNDAIIYRNVEDKRIRIVRKWDRMVKIKKLNFLFIKTEEFDTLKLNGKWEIYDLKKKSPASVIDFNDYIIINKNLTDK